MNSDAGRGDAYRLLVSVEGRCAVAEESQYRRFDQAQSRVAHTVLRHARIGRIDSVILQRGRPLADLMPRSAETESLAIDSRHEWIVEKRWGPEVVKRILEQNGIPHVAPKEASPASGLRARARRYASLHRNTRWHIAGTAALVALMILTILLAQTGGRLDGFFTPTASGMKTELPFDARMDFETASEFQRTGSANTHRAPSTQRLSRTSDPDLISGPMTPSVQISKPAAP